MKDAVSFICSLDKYSLDIRYAPNAVLGAGLRASPWHLAGAGDGGTGKRPSPLRPSLGSSPLETYALSEHCRTRKVLPSIVFFAHMTHTLKE